MTRVVGRQEFGEEPLNIFGCLPELIFFVLFPEFGALLDFLFTILILADRCSTEQQRDQTQLPAVSIVVRPELLPMTYLTHCTSRCTDEKDSAALGRLNVLSPNKK